MSSTRPVRAILAVTGSEKNMRTLTLLLERFHYKVISAETSLQAREQLSAHRPALVIADLPEKAGLELLDQVRRHEGLPTVFAVSSSDASLESRYLDYGAVSCIAKPIQAEELYRTVQAVLEARPRVNIRIDTRLPVSIDQVPLPCPGGMCSIDLSERGMYLPLEQPSVKGKIAVGIRIKDRTINAQAAVLYSHAGVVGTHPAGVGLKFVELDRQDQNLIRSYILEEVTKGIEAAPSDPWS